MTQPSAFVDPYREPDARGWHIVDACAITRDLELECDVAIVGTGAGGGVCAEVLAQAGLCVVMVEEGPLRTSSDFRMREAEAYPALYQESAARKTADHAINILQGRCVGGSTTVNWTSSFRTPAATLAHWRDTHGINGYTAEELALWFGRMEARLGIAPWTAAPNGNNAALVRGAGALGIPVQAIARNVRGCADLGYCGVGCPINAKQSMLVTTIPVALAHGATLLTRTRALRLSWSDRRVTALECAALDGDGVRTTGRSITVRARTYISSAGAIGSPALLLRSHVPDPHELVGTRTFLHPVVVSAALMRDTVAPYAGAPQSVCSDHFLDDAPATGPIGYKLEAPPVHPVLAAITLPNHGVEHARWMRELPRMQVLIALLRDGFHRESSGGTVRLSDDGSPVLDYPITDYVWDGVRRAFMSMAQIQFAAGAMRVLPVHGRGEAFEQWTDARRAIAAFDLAPVRTPVFSAHVMGGCAMGPNADRAVVDPDGRHHHLENLHVIDGSIFPTSIGANPQLSIYAIAVRLAESVARRLSA